MNEEGKSVFRKKSQLPKMIWKTECFSVALTHLKLGICTTSGTQLFLGTQTPGSGDAESRPQVSAEGRLSPVVQLPPLHPGLPFSGDAVSLDSGVLARLLATSCLLKVTDTIKDDHTSLVTITLCPSLACPQFQLPHSGSINYYSNCFS